MKPICQPLQFKFDSIREIIDRRSSGLPLSLSMNSDEHARHTIDDVALSLDLFSSQSARRVILKPAQTFFSSSDNEYHLAFDISADTLGESDYSAAMRSSSPIDLVGCAHLSFRETAGTESVVRYFSFEPPVGRLIGPFGWHEKEAESSESFHRD